MLLAEVDVGELGFVFDEEGAFDGGDDGKRVAATAGALAFDGGNVAVGCPVDVEDSI